MLKLPKIVDPDPQDRPGLAFIDFGEASLFIDGKFPSFLISPPISPSSTGVFPVTLTITDNHIPGALTEDYSFELDIRDPDGLI